MSSPHAPICSQANLAKIMILCYIAAVELVEPILCALAKAWRQNDPKSD